MTTTPSDRAAAARWTTETVVFAGATALGLVHSLDDAFVDRQPGVDLGQHALAAAITVVLGVGAVVGFPRLRPGLRAAVALTFGSFAIVNGAIHVIHMTGAGS